MTGSQARIALQLYTLRAHLQSESEVAGTLGRVREIGYEWVEIAGVCAMPALRLRELIHAAGLGIRGTHESGRDIVERPEWVADRLAELGCRLTAYPYPHEPLDTLDAVLALADALNRAGEVLRSRGVQLTYHNHALEFRKLGGKTILDWLFERTDPILVQAELDTFWVQAGGGDPAAYCARLSGRLPLVHLKDYAVGPEQEPRMAALGQGNLAFPTILREAEAAGASFYVVEQDRDFDDGFEAIATSLRYLHRLCA